MRTSGAGLRIARLSVLAFTFGATFRGIEADASSLLSSAATRLGTGTEITPFAVRWIDG